MNTDPTGVLLGRFMLYQNFTCSAAVKTEGENVSPPVFSFAKSSPLVRGGQGIPPVWLLVMIFPLVPGAELVYNEFQEK